MFTSSTQSPGLPSADSTSLIRTGLHAFARPRVEAVVSRKSPVPSGQRPQVVAACAPQVVVSTWVVPSGRSSVTLSPTPRPKPGVCEISV